MVPAPAMRAGCYGTDGNSAWQPSLAFLSTQASTPTASAQLLADATACPQLSADVLSWKWKSGCFSCLSSPVYVSFFLASPQLLYNLTMLHKQADLLQRRTSRSSTAPLFLLPQNGLALSELRRLGKYAAIQLYPAARANEGSSKAQGTSKQKREDHNLVQIS